MHAETPARPPGTNGSGALLSVHGLTISFGADDGDGAALEAVDLELGAGEVLGVVGASGSGKSTLALALLGMLDPPGRRRAGGVRFDGRELFESSRAELDRIRGGQIALVFQEPLTAFNPVWTVGEQIAEGLRLHAGLDGRAARGRAIEALAEVGLPDPGGVARRYPHQLSGGMRQRAMIAMAIAPRPRVLVADEPTTALDATLRGELLGLFGRLAREHGLTLVLVSHDLGAVAQVAERAVVLERGRVVEQGTVEELFERPQHAATRALVGAAVRLAPPPGPTPAGAPVIGGEAAPARELELLRPERPPLLELAELEVVHPGRRRWLRREADVDAVRGVSLRVGRGEVVALVGESGCGKSTLARCAVGLVEPRGGAVVYHGPASEGPARQSLFALDPARRRALLARRVGIVFQDPVSSLNPRHRVLRIVGEAPRVHGLLAGPGQSRGADGREGDERARPLVERWLARVGLEPAAAVAGSEEQDEVGLVAVDEAVVVGDRLVVLG